MNKARLNVPVRRSDLFLAAVLALSAVVPGCGGSPLPPPEGVEVASVERIAALIENARGKALVVNLWATWCPPCVSEMPEFVTFYQERAVDKVEFLSLSYDDPKKFGDTVRPFHERHRLPFPVLVVEQISDLSALDRALRAELSGVLPTTLLYSPDGQIAKVWEGPITRSDLENALQALR